MQIKYTVWHYEKVRRKKVVRTTNGEIEWDGNWDNDDHAQLRAMIHSANPGKHIMGYCPADRWDEFREQISRDNDGITI